MTVNLEAERNTLACLIEPAALSGLIDTLKPGDYSRADYAAIFGAAVDLFRRGQAVDLVTLGDNLRARGESAALGAVSSLAGQISTSANWPHWARIVREKSQLRGFMAELKALQNKRVDDIPAFMAASTARLLDLAASAGDKTPDLKALTNSAWDDLAAQASGPPGAFGVPTGFHALDKMTGGLRPGQLWIVAARPSLGKTSLALQVALGAALEGTRTVFFSFEMAPEELAKRALIGLAGLTPDGFKTDSLLGKQSRFTEAATRLNSAALFIEPGRGRTVTELRARALRLKVEAGGLGLVAVDYLGLITPDAGRGRSREQEISKISRDLKTAATDLAAPILALSQLNRLAEGRGDGEPRLSDLRDSGSIEQDADAVLLIHRPGKFKSGGAAGDVRLIVAKNRNGPTGIVRLRFNEPLMTFEEPGL